MEPLDGNAVAGKLLAAFDAEMTSASATCGNCGMTGFVGELAAYFRGPGTVLRCPSCDNVLIVLTEIRGITCVGTPGLAALEPA